MSTAIVRAVTAVAVAEMALTRRDPVTGALLAQAARAIEGLAHEREVALAADIARQVDITSTEPGPFAARKVAQALCRVAVTGLQTALLAQAPRASTSRNASP